VSAALYFPRVESASLILRRRRRLALAECIKAKVSAPDLARKTHVYVPLMAIRIDRMFT
jgi:hypothetical protein